jgi:hypothetical protein
MAASSGLSSRPTIRHQQNGGDLGVAAVVEILSAEVGGHVLARNVSIRRKIRPTEKLTMTA